MAVLLWQYDLLKHDTNIGKGGMPLDNVLAIETVNGSGCETGKNCY
jgi:hypothetical protein